MQLLKDGCAHMRKAFDIEDLNLDALIDTAMDDPKSLAGEIKAFRGINFDDLAHRRQAVLRQRTVRQQRAST